MKLLVSRMLLLLLFLCELVSASLFVPIASADDDDDFWLIAQVNNRVLLRSAQTQHSGSPMQTRPASRAEVAAKKKECDI